MAQQTRPSLAAACVLSTLSLAGCLDNKLADGSAQTPNKVFIAQTRDFRDFRDWMAFEQDVQGDHGGLAGQMTVYLNNPPADNATQFDVGTIVVKTMKPADSDEVTIHAMAKRGGDFNPDGAVGWEYFELAFDDDVPIILWSGSEPPSGEEYQRLLGDRAMSNMDVTGDCNGCHADGRDGMLGSLADLLEAP